MRTFFHKALELIADVGICPVCYRRTMGKSGLNSYYCTYCEVTMLIEKDLVIFKEYKIRHGRRVLETHECHSDRYVWEDMVNRVKEGTI